jgi:exodeoxyribonuclease-3
VLLATWNVNSVRAREARLLAFLEREKPDVVCLQELKVVDDDFPLDAVRSVGYRAETYGQKTYNGVGILARTPIENVTTTMQDGADDPQARVIAADVLGVRVVSVYVPNGGEVGSDKWDYKRAWLKRFAAYVDRQLDLSKPVAICGDFNIAPEERDVAKPESWRGSTLFHPELSATFGALLGKGLRDLGRAANDGPGPFTWWDYRMLAFPKGDGLRIDHILASEPLAKSFRSFRVDRDERKGKQPSDHAPVLAEFGV